MKIVLLSVFFYFSNPCIGWTQDSVYDVYVTTIEGKQLQIAAFRGQKILIVVLPGKILDADTSLLNSIKSAKKDFTKSLAILAVPSVEDGYNVSLRNLKRRYRSHLGDDVIVLQGMATKKTTPGQSELFKWLTDKEKNGHFDVDSEGSGQKFFINELGQLYAVVGSLAHLSPRLMEAAFLNTKNKQ